MSLRQPLDLHLGTGRAGGIVDWAWPMALNLAWHRTVEVPHDADWSKNRETRHARGRHYKNPRAQAHRESLAFLLRSELRTAPLVHDRLWLGVHVVKADHRTDALNVLDLVADGVQDATGIDDRWFSLYRITWDVDRERPRMLVSVGQEVGATDSNFCGRCQRVLPLADFHRRKGSRLGVGSTCRECSRRKR